MLLVALISKWEYIYIYIYIYWILSIILVKKNTHTHKHKHTHIYIYIDRYIYVYIYINTYIYIYAVYSYIIYIYHIYIYIYIYIYIWRILGDIRQWLDTLNYFLNTKTTLPLTIMFCLKNQHNKKPYSTEISQINNSSNRLTGLMILHKKITFSVKDFFNKCYQIPRFLSILSDLMKKYFFENFFFIYSVINITTMKCYDWKHFSNFLIVY